VGPADRRYRSIAARPAGAQQQGRRSSNGEQCHVYSRRRRLDTDLFCSAVYIYIQLNQCRDLSMRSRGARHRMHVDGRPGIVGYLLCVMVVLKTAAAAVEQTSAAESTGSSVQVTEYKLNVSTLIHRRNHAQHGTCGTRYIPSTLQNEGTKTIWSPPLRLI